MIESAILHFFYHTSFEIAAKFASGYKKNVRLDYRFCETLRLTGKSLEWKAGNMRKKRAQK